MGGTTRHVVRLRQSARRPHFAARLQTNYREPIGWGGGRPGSGKGEPEAGKRGGEGGGGGLPIRFHPVLPPPPRRVAAARAAGGAAAARQPSFAKALGAPRPAGNRHAPAAPARCPRGRSTPPRARRRRSPRGGRPGCQLNLLLQKWKRSQKRRQERINLQTRKCKQKGKGEQRESRPKWLTRKLKKIYLQKTEKLKMRVQPLMKQERKKPSLINIIYHVLSVVPVSLLVQSRGIFLSTIL